MAEITVQESELFSEISRLIRESHNRVAAAVNAEMTELYWQVGDTINQKVLGGERAEYGAEVVRSLSKRLTEAYGRGWGVQHLRHCMRLARTFPHDEKFYALRRELSWTSIRALSYIENPIERDFYTEMCKLNHWSSRTLNDRIKSMLFERTAISKKPEETIENDLAQLRETGEVSEELVFRDPYFLDYLGLRDSYSERDLETAIIAELQQFIAELGNDFAFLDRQKRITIDGEDYYLDLLFFHRRLRRLVAIELKLGKFEAAYKGQMELYLRWLEKYEMVEGEKTPIGLILCSGKNDEHIELMGLDEGSIRVAEYLTQLPDRKLLEEKLRLSIERAKRRVSAANAERG
ncbi:DUF1016 family protein [Enterorhabdus mucosicola]|uniref:DUF1016 family protein n=1 Tax=Adlercreutzia mucosicola TaxID=580026 RepID=A0A6N8JNS6_9ACTN|nr:PDDEXK nuclease domain-containing protein [Adlercreutzia mucosicola]MVX61521.1 DUF1016 family protein [Adlercreutzia mucosicola]